jgi:hypothetical protein
VSIGSQLKKWFEHPGRPSEESPVGRLMIQLLALNPSLSFSDAREEARRRCAAIAPVPAPDSPYAVQYRQGAIDTRTDQGCLQDASGSPRTNDLNLNR